ncbi:MAG: sigma-70 family RNA polymerase sigma factor [Planctomycetota bacterium]|nr:sigma-70 family RNA polymerase sigma factor [Planctomycetota bacterium]
MFRVAGGDVQAFKALYEAYFSRIVSFLSRYGCSGVEDMAQEVFVRVWEHRDRFAGRSGTKTYLMGITRNVLRESRRQSGRWPVSCDSGVLGKVVADDPEEQPDADLIKTLEQAKVYLSPNQLQAIELVYHSQIKPAEAAALAGCSYKAMCRRLEEARLRLREVLEQRLQS